jgi:hypothetical protein
MRGIPGKGLTYKHRDMTNQIADDLEDLVTGATTLSWQNLNRVSAPPGIEITNTIIFAIRKRDANAQDEMIKKLAGEIAYAKLIEQGRLITQVMRTGVKEPNISNFEPAKEVVNEAIDQLQVELDQLDKEIKTRQMVAKNTLNRIMGLEEKAVQETRAFRTTKPSGVNTLGQP